jgi:hypothetical protein
MGIFDSFQKTEQNDNSQDRSQDNSPLALPVLCYRTAYFVLPQLLFSDAERVVGYFTENEYPAGPFLYVLATRVLEIEGNREDALSFHTHTVELSDGVACYILEYPTPPAVDLTQRPPVLAPYFSAILRDSASAEVSYYVLGQNPFNDGTTLRAVTPDGLNCNLGPGPSPELDSFIGFLQQKA